MNKVNFKLVNFVLIIVIIFFMYKLFPLMKNTLFILKKIFLPIILSFVISYSIYPLVLCFRRKINKLISVILTILITLSIIFFLLYFSLPIVIKEFSSLIRNLISYYPHLLSLNLPSFITEYFNSFLLKTSLNFYSISLDIITKSINIIINTILVSIMSILMLYNMDSFRMFLKNKFYLKKEYFLLLKIDNELNKYIKSMSIIIVIEMIEYTLIYFIVGHPYYYLLGFLAGITTIIPYFGALFTNFIAFVTVINVSRKLFIITILIALVIPIFDNYVIDPKIMSKKTKISFLEVIISIIISSAIFGVIGFVIAVPLYIIVKNIIKFYFFNK